MPGLYRQKQRKYLFPNQILPVSTLCRFRAVRGPYSGRPKESPQVSLFPIHLYFAAILSPLFFFNLNKFFFNNAFLCHILFSFCFFVMFIIPEYRIFSFSGKQKETACAVSFIPFCRIVCEQRLFIYPHPACDTSWHCPA